MPSSDTTLSGLTVSQGTLSPTFASSTVTYTDSVANSVTSMTVTPTVNTAGATVKVNGNTVASGSASSAISLSVGSNTITVVVTAPDGTTTQNYVITVTRATAATAITSAGVTGFVAPAKGATPEVVGSLVSGAPTQYTVTSLTWSPTDSPYKASTVYTATVVLTSATGYTFSTAITPTVNTGTPSAGTVTGTGSGNTLTFTVTFPATAATTITTAAISGVTAPVTGATAVTTVSDNGQYSGTVSWSPALTGGKFGGSQIYTATITLTADAGYTFTGVTANFFTVAGSTSATNSANSGVVTAAFPATSAIKVTIPAISGVTPPVAGATAVTTVSDNGQYSGTVSWSPALTGGKFGGSQIYTATITLTADAGYTFTGVTANFFTVAGSTSATNSANSGVVTAAFPATSAIKVTIPAISGVTPPVAGATAVTTVSDNGQYSGTVSWSPALTGGKFGGSQIYTATITLTADAGYTFTGVTANFFTVAGSTSATNSANSGVVTAAFPATSAIKVTIPAISGVTAPAKGATAVTTVSDNGQYSGTVSWSPALTGGKFSMSSKTYTATITLTADAGYTFTGVTANFFTVAGSTSATNSANSGVVTAAFPAT